MNGTVKNILVFTGGFISGVAATYFLATRFIEFEWPSEEETEPEKEDEPTPEIEVEANDGDISGTPVEIEKIDYNPQDGDPDYTNYANIVNPDGEEIEDDPALSDYIPPQVEVFGDPDALPCVIEESEYGVDPDYDEIDLNYYEKEDLLTDCWDYPIEDIPRTVGDDAMQKCREGDTDMVYVRNDRLKAYYEIARQTLDYPGVTG